MRTKRHYLQEYRWPIGLTMLFGVCLLAPVQAGVSMLVAGAAIASWVAMAVTGLNSTQAGRLESEPLEDPPSNTGIEIDGRVEAAALFSTIHEGVGHMVGTMRHEISQIGIVQRDAVAGLNETFRELARHVTRQQHIVASVICSAGGESDAPGRDGPEGESQPHAEVSAISAMIDQSLASAVRCLQFEDMLAQLLHHVDRRCMLLEGVMHGLTDEQSKLMSATDGDPVNYSRSLESLGQMIFEHTQLFDEIGGQVVTQTSMEEGVIELF